MKHIRLFESFQDFDLDKEFDYLNKVLFDGSLERIPIKWSNTKTRSGALVGSVIKRGRTVIEQKVSHIEVSRFFNKSKEQLQGILAHEMIHLWIFQNNIKDDSHHGYEFMKKFKELNDKGIIQIPLKDTVADDELTDSRPMSSQVVAFYSNDKTRSVNLIALIDEKTFDAKVLDSIIDTVAYTSKVGKRDFELIFVKTNDGFLKRYPKTVKFKHASGLKYAQAPDSSVITRITENGTILAVVDVTGGNVKTVVRNI